MSVVWLKYLVLFGLIVFPRNRVGFNMRLLLLSSTAEDFENFCGNYIYNPFFFKLQPLLYFSVSALITPKPLCSQYIDDLSPCARNVFSPVFNCIHALLLQSLFLLDILLVYRRAAWQAFGFAL